MPLLDEDYLILSTIHSAKGQEWKSVYLLNVVDGCMPSDLGAGTLAAIEEERRRLYVATTCIWSCRSASLCTANMRRAIVTSMPPGRVSFPKSYSICSSGRLGQLCLPAALHAPPARAQSWISAPACAECGDRRETLRNDRVQSLFDHHQPGRQSWSATVPKSERSKLKAYKTPPFVRQRFAIHAH